MRVFPGVWKFLFFKTPFPRWISAPPSFVSLFIFYIFSYLFLKTRGCLSGCQHSEVVLWNLLSVQMLFWWICGGESSLSVLLLCHLRTPPPGIYFRHVNTRHQELCILVSGRGLCRAKKEPAVYQSGFNYRLTEISQAIKRKKMYLLQEIKCLQSCGKPKESGLRLHLGIIPRIPSQNQPVKETAILGQLERWQIKKLI